MDEIQNCSICLRDIENEECLTIQCNHTFHKSCILNWFRTPSSSGNCPLCNDNPHNCITVYDGYSSYGFVSDLYVQRYKLIKKHILKSSDVVNINIIKNIKIQENEVKQLIQNEINFKKDDYYKAINTEISINRKTKYTLLNKIKKQKIKLISKNPLIFL
tara:strand:+ start:181 stop:660 length:480 start_codon:yes stop_codon:yes gene_type:complete